MAMAVSAKRKTVTTQSSTESDVIKSITQILTAIRKLDLFSLVDGTLLGLTNCIDDLSQNISHYPNPKIEYEVEELKQKLMELKTMIMHSFIPGCKSVAKFATRKEQLQRIRRNLEAGKVEELQEFLATLKNRFNNCKKRADEFKKKYDALKKEIGIAIVEHGSEQRGLEEGIETKEIYRWTAGSVGGAAVVAGVLTATGGVVGLVPVSAAYAVFSGGLLAGAAASATAGGITIAKEYSKKDRDLMKSVTDRINKMNQEMGEIHIKFQRILLDLNNAEDDLATEIEGRSITGRDVESIMEALEEFKESMEKLLTTCDSIVM